MNRALAVLILLTGLGLASCATMGPGTSTQITAGVDITNAPPPPIVTYGANVQWRYVSDRGIWVPSDDSYQYDMFRYGTWVYLYSNGYWYRSSNYGGPYVVIETRRVPHRIFELDDRDYHWRNRPQAWRPGDHGHERDHDRD
jgi:hypothetical protein